jgi:streptogramin lyase
MKARMYSVILQQRGHILFTTQHMAYGVEYIQIPKAIPQIMDPFLLWYSLPSGKGVNSFTVKTNEMSFTMNRTNDLARLEPILRDSSEVAIEKIKNLRDEIILSLEGIRKELK